MNKVAKVIIVLVTLFLIAGALLFFTPSNKTYTDQQYGFQFTYPRGLKLDVKKSSNNSEFIIKNPDKDITYFDLNIDKKGESFKEPTGPFPQSSQSMIAAGTTDRGVLNGISGYKSYESVEGGGGEYESFMFIKNDTVWYIDLDPLHGLDEYTKVDPTDKKIFEGIKASFRLI